MTRINKIIMQGFKSFARQTEIPLGDHFNVVLGPNGSGKSNLMDAICFVLGKLGAKGMRAEKQANLIYDGGKAKQKAKFAKVSIHFDNSNNSFPLDTKEIVISRKVLPSGTSVYKINDKSVSRRDIIDLLSTARIDPNGYNIILQGDISKFIEMSNENRRLVIEEVANITLYEERKHQALNELRRVEDKLNEAKIVLTERKTYLEELKQEHDQAVKYKEMAEQVEKSKATLLHLQMRDKKGGLTRIDNREKKYGGERQQINKRSSDLSAGIQNTKHDIDLINMEIEEKGEKGQVDMHNKIEDIRVKISTNSARVESCKQELNKIQQRREQLKRQQNELNDKTSSLDRESKTLTTDKSELEKEREGLANKLARYRESHKLGDSTKIEAEIDKIDKEYEELSNGLLILREKQQALLREKDRLEIQLDNMDQRIAKLAQIESQNKKELEQLKQIRAKFKKATVELNRLLNEDSALAARLGTMRQQFMDAREEFAKLRERSQSLKEKISGDAATKRILQTKMPGVRGTVSALGSVKSAYALALDVAAGARLKNIVVENVETAARCIKLLKENRLGVATFLPMDKLRVHTKNPSIDKLKSASGVVGLAIDLISFNQKYRKVFGYVFRDTLVVETIEVARRLGVGTARMVTLEGDLVEMSGAMIGGFRAKRTQALGFQEEEVSKHLVDVQGRVEDLTRAVIGLEKKKTDNEQTIASLRNEKAELEAEIIKGEKSLHLDSEDLEATSQEKSTIKSNFESTKLQLGSINKEIAGTTKQLTSKKMGREQLKQQLSSIRDPRILAEIASFDERLRKIQEELLSIDSHLKTNRLQKDEMFGREQDRVIQVLKQLDKEQLGFEKELQGKQLSNNQLSKQLVEMEKKSEDFYSKYKALFKKRNELAETLRDKEVSLAQLNEQLRQLGLKENSLSLDRATLKAQLSGLEEEYNQFEGVDLIEGKSISYLRSEIGRYEAMVAGYGNVNLKALEIYDQMQEEYNLLVEKREKLLGEKEDVEKMMHEIEMKKKGLFMKLFEALNKNFQEFFQKLSTKGEAYLKLENEENPFEAGVEIKVKLSGKRFIDIRGLSGGEKAMTALALIFAIQEYEPASFYIMDEVDAALDKRNSEKLAKLICQYSKRAQYLVISHNDYMIQEADTLFGVSMTEHGVSKVVSLRV